MHYFVVDAFTSQAFSGNPAAVCILDAPLDDAVLTAIAAEFNLSETAYLIRKGNDVWGLRWFTPTTEVNLCGHATLAAAWVLWTEQNIDVPVLRFITRSGELIAERSPEGVALNFPLITTEPLAEHEPLQALFPHALAFASAGEDLLVELASESEVESWVADMPAIAALPCRGVSVTAAVAHKPYKVVSRFFAPRFGIDEDPVTGSLHCALADYWGKKLRVESFIARQASSRGGLIQVERQGLRVVLTGQAVVVMIGVLCFPK
ncbi:MAG TPA: PhzF family phenazine biosynthesis isomerase [Cellvibrionaceae bacterium]